MTGPPPAAVVLAAGRGSRFGGPHHKLLTPVAGRPVVAHVLDAVLRADFPAVYVVVGAVDLAAVLRGRDPAVVRVVENPDWEQGQATSVRAGVWAARADGYSRVVVGLGDQPGVTAAGWRAVADAPDAAIAVAVYGEKRRNPVRLDATVWPHLPERGDAGARSLFAQERFSVVEVPCSGDPSDIDTEDDLHHWERPSTR